ncbi:MAG: radical SAM protein [Patescibacteria group bacterium]
MKNFLLVVPRFAKVGGFYNFPLGLAYISSSLKSKGFNVHCLNLCHSDEPLEIIIGRWIKDKNIDVLGTGGMSQNWDVISAVLNAAKTVKPDIVTVVGGAIVVSDPELALKTMRIDFGIIGEGEVTMLELSDYLCRNEDPKKIDGITYLDKDKNKVIVNRNRARISNLDELPFPDYVGFEFDQWKTLARFSINSDMFNKDDLNYVQMLGSRSCPFSCTFCFHHMGQKYSERSLDSIFKEIDYLVEKHQINFFYFLDELLSANPTRLMEFAMRIKNYPIYGWAGSFRVTDTTVERLKTLKDSKLALMGYGIENINDSILKSMNKRITKAEIENALKAHHEVGLFCTGNIILGDPAETKETLKASVDYWLSHPQYNLNLIFLMPIPDSKIYRLALEKNLIKDKLKHIRDGFPMVNLTAISDKEFYKLQSRIMWMKHKYQQMREGELVGVKRAGEFKNKRKYLISVKCPFCGYTTEHLTLEDDRSWFYASLCNHCASASKIKSTKVFFENKNLLKRRLNYFSLFIMSYLARFKFYRENRVAIIKILRKIKYPISFIVSLRKKMSS